MTSQQRVVQAIFRLWSPFYDFWPAQALFYRPVHRAMLALLDGDAPRAVLDLGCGTGQLTADLRARFPSARVAGVDLSDAMLRQARGRVPLPVRASVYALPFADGAFTLVTSSISYHFYLEPERALAEIRRVLAPGGRFVLATLAPPRPRLFRALHGPMRHMRVTGADEVAGELAAAGFRVLRRERARGLVAVFAAA
jgi:ubiquinone/menaquinone biosynthesis C-methylase UbiE